MLHAVLRQPTYTTEWMLLDNWWEELTVVCTANLQHIRPPDRRLHLYTDPFGPNVRMEPLSWPRASDPAPLSPLPCHKSSSFLFTV